MAVTVGDPDDHDDDREIPAEYMPTAMAGAQALLDHLQRMDEIHAAFAANALSPDALKPVTAAMAALPDANKMASTLGAGLLSLANVSKMITDSLANLDWAKTLSDRLVQLGAFSDTFVRAVIAQSDNWRGWPADRPIVDVIEELAQAGYPVCWVPRHEVILALYDADPTKRPTVLVEHQISILNDCMPVLDEVTDPTLTGLRDALYRANAAFLSGHIWAAQSLAAGIIDTALRAAFSHLEKFTYGKAVTEVKKTTDASIADYRQAATYWPLVKALTSFWPGDPIPMTFNRHASAHAVSSAQYNDANAIVAIMLATSMLRELQQNLTDAGEDEQLVA
ncbi:hypothetical protein GCM10009827_109660 [Dactylosporangium maewongense]|uniref:Uncharacterized protein n=1 Tax=Dactylosporangium maewongense TaxID=634393 RepID=A0ABN2D3U8_9ACTN